MTSTRQRGWLLYSAIVLCLAGSCMQALAQNDACGDELIQLGPTKAYQLRSNNYPSDVTTALHCNWTIQAAPEIRIKLILRDLHIDHYRDNLTVANVPATTYSSVDYILKHFREVKVQVVLSSGHVMRVELTVDLDWPMNSGTTYGRRYWLEFQPVSADASLTTVCSNLTGLYLCANQRVCVNRSGLCDTIMDCPDQSDELGCPHTCPSNEYCSNTSACLLRRFHCDGIQDCSAGEDEKDCDLPVCPKYCSCQEHVASTDGNNLIVNCSNLPDLSDVWLNLPPTTIKLVLKRNNITDLEPGSFATLPLHLQHLILEDNKLTRLKLGVFRGLRKLTLLRININNLSIIDSGVFQTLESLTVLRLDNNNITELFEGMFKGLHTLKYLRLGGNRIRRLKANTFRHLTNLTSLDLVRNQISSIDPGAFEGLTSLVSLGLRDNLLKVLRANMFVQLKSLTDLSLEYNPWTVIEPGAFNGLERLQLLSLARKTEDIKDFTVDKHELENMNNLEYIVVDDKRMCCLLSHRVNGIAGGCIKSNQLKVKLEFLTCDRLMHNSVLRIFIWCLGISALIGNMFIIIWRLRMPDTGKRSQSVLILNLALSDLLMGLYMLVIAGADAHFQDAFFLHVDNWRTGHLCNFAGFLSMLSSEASVFFITLISIDRFLCVVFPFGKKWLRLDTARVASLAMWAIALLISIPPLLLQDMIPGFYGLSDVCVGLPMKRAHRTSITNKPALGNVDLGGNVTVYESATPSRVFSVTVYLGINLVCCLVVLLCYMAIAFVVTVKLPSKKLHKRKDKEHRRKEMAMARRMLLIVGTDFCCWMPVIVMGILSMSGAVDIPDEAYAWVVVFVIPINSAINPYLYTFSNSNAVSLDCCKFRRAGSSMNSVKMKPLPSNDKDTNQRCRSGTHTIL